MTAKTLFIALATVLLLSGPANAQSPEAKGLGIAQDAAARSSGYVDFTASGNMLLHSKSGGTSKRDFDFKSLEATEGDRTVLVFNWPGDIRNTGLLTHTYKGRDDDQWLYLPSYQRIKRISSSSRSGSFVGSEFAYEDMIDQEVEKFTYLWIMDEKCPGSNLTCHVIDRFPKYDSGYTRQRLWIDEIEMRVFQIYYFDRRDSHLKTMEASDFRQYRGKFWKAEKLVMSNHLTGKSTTLTWRNFEFGVGLPSSLFSVNELSNIR